VKILSYILKLCKCAVLTATQSRIIKKYQNSISEHFFSITETELPDVEIMDDSVLNESQVLDSSKTSETSLTRTQNETTKTGEEVSGLDLKRPRKVKDFTVLANLVELAQHCIPKCDQKW
jgi:hypothetical protein